LRSEASFASLCGVSPVPASSGKTVRHRLNRGGDRAANSALHIIAIGRLRTDQRTKDYVARRLAEGHSKLDAIRALKLPRQRGLHAHHAAAKGNQRHANRRLTNRRASGGSNALGLIGYVRAARELLEQARVQQVEFTHVVLASASGGTQAGLALGLALEGSNAPVIGYCVARASTDLRPRIAAQVRHGAELLGVASPLTAEDLFLEDGVVGHGYGLPTPAMAEAVRLAATQEGLVLDPVYTGKALAGLIADVRAGRYQSSDVVIFLHTGGTPGLFAYPDSFPVRSEA
jgi:1-aminocyclopropane-1-carboxylate deaminase/D-cysteine desulfhydrase-like pyridoxal-dependent ACC family enzyme